MNGEGTFYQTDLVSGGLSARVMFCRFSTVDHIHTLRQVIQKTEEYNLPLCLAFVNYEKAFDSIATWAVLQFFLRCQIDYRYIEVRKLVRKRQYVMYLYH